MQKKSIVLCLLMALGFSLSAQVYNPPRPLFTLQTEHFTIIFPRECRASAEYLQSIAEDAYTEVAGKLGAEKKLRIPVLITPDSESLNGSFSFMPTRITLFQAPISPNSGFAAFNDEMRKLFLHELTHAVSLNSRSGFWEFLTGVFCPELPVAFALAPYSFVEGVTVSFESADGFGRANDTPYAAIIRQDIIEGKFKSFAQAAGAWGMSRYPSGIPYVYGGYFSKYLQVTYGMEKYAQLWKKMGEGNFIVGFEGLGPFLGAFEATYGVKLDQAWAAFGTYMSLKAPVVAERHPISAGPEGIDSVASDGSRVYWADTQWVRRYDPASGKTEALFRSDGSVTRLFPSADGAKLLISRYRYGAGNQPKAMLQVYDIAANRFEAVPQGERLQEAAWLADGSLVATRIIGYGYDLVRVKDGQETVLFHGTEKFCPSQPYPWGADGVVFLLQRQGVNSIARLNLTSGKLEILKSSRSLERMRHLYSDGARIAVSFDSSDSLMQYARYADGQLSAEKTLLSGGVQAPVLCGSETYYAGYFSAGQELLRYPEENPALALEPIDSAWEPLDLPTEQLASAYDRVSDQKVGSYSPLPWLLNPVLRLPLINYNMATLGVNGAGLHVESMDPTESLAYVLEGAYLWNSTFANAGASLSLSALPLSPTLAVKDSLAIVPTGSESTYGTRLQRTLAASLSLSTSAVLFPATRSLSFSLSGGAAWVAPGLAGSLLGEAETSPYSWAFTGFFYPLNASLKYADISASTFNRDGPLGFSLALGYNGYLEGTSLVAPKGVAVGNVAFYLPLLNFTSSINGAVAAHPDVALGTAGPLLADGSSYLGSHTYTDYTEYASLSSAGSWLYLYQDTQISKKFMTDAPIWGDFYMRSFNLGGGYRSAYVNWGYLQSVYGFVDFGASLCRGPLSMLQVTTRLELAQPSYGDMSPQLRFLFGFSY